MSLETLRGVLLWCTILNFGVLALWGAIMMLPHGWVHALWCRRLRMSPEQFDAICFAGLLGYKMLIVFFNLMPYVALWIVAGRPGG